MGEEKKLLQGKRIVVTRAREQAGEMVEMLQAQGAVPVICPAIAITPPESYQPLDDALRRLDQYDWLIFTSANTVQAIAGRMQTLGIETIPASVRIAAVGPATASALGERYIPTHFIPTTYTAEALAAQMPDVTGQRILLPQANLARETLATLLRARDAQVDAVIAYCTVPAPGLAEIVAGLEAGMIDAVTFTSSSTVRYFLEGLALAGLTPEQTREVMARPAIVCIGPSTAQTAREQGLQVSAVAVEHTVAGMVAALLEWFANRQ